MPAQSNQIFLANEAATLEFAARMAQYLNPGQIINLEGELGAGKTYLAKGLIGGLGINISEVTSPTFNLVNEYQTTSFGVLHCDFYRLPEGDLLMDFGGLEFFSQKKIFLVEWLSRLGIPRKSIKNQIFTIKIEIKDSGRWCSYPEKWK